MTIQTAAELAAEWRCSTQKVCKAARRFGIGTNLEGRAGWRFNESQKAALWQAMQPAPAEPERRYRKTRRTA